MMKSLPPAIVILTVGLAAAATATPRQWLQYDNGNPYQPVYREHAGDGWGVKFIPPSAGYILRVSMYVGNPPGNSSWDGFYLEIWDWNAGQGKPGSRKWGPQPFTYDHGTWVEYAGVNYHWPNSSAFVVLVTQRYDAPQCETIYCDEEQTEPNPNLGYYNGNWSLFTLVDGDFLMRAYYGGMDDVAPTTLGRIKTLFR